MRVSLRATYGILAALDLALHTGPSPVQARMIARRQEIPSRFLEQVLHTMKKAGLVESHRGAQGGYLLSKAPEELSLAQILEALDGPVIPSPARDGAARRRRGRGRLDVALSSVWDRVHRAELEVLTTITLRDLAEQQKLVQDEDALMYHI